MKHKPSANAHKSLLSATKKSSQLVTDQDQMMETMFDLMIAKRNKSAQLSKSNSDSDSTNKDTSENQ